ncbi:hypothetical protein [Citrobacter freundii]|uniref:hypothetical protein n=1 Tax=Citrobacter freundii TaxID=546 RepID=UPI000EF29B41|nr:hypothetical protein [Citrobacter freundii]AYL51299.1 hypothetical protein CUC47_06975 [Citrobacter freundii]
MTNSPMTALNKEALRQTAEKAQEHGVFNMDIHSQTVLDLLNELEAAEKRITDYHTVLNNLAAVARRYLPDYDEHPDIQAADDLLESAAGIGVKGE